MMASTHAAIGVVVYSGLCASMGVEITPAALGASAIGALLPDADTTHSKAGLCLYPLAFWLEKKFGHRTITHSFFGTLLFATLCAPLLWWPRFELIYFALLCGYASHLLADAATKSGVPLAWPNRRAWVFPGPEEYRVRTGSRAELGVLLVFLLIGMLTIPIQRLGVRRLLHLATNSLGGAVRDAEDWSDYRQVARVSGYDVLNQRVVEGTFPVVGRRDDGALVVERDDTPGYWLLKDGGSELHRIAPRTVRIDKVAASHSQTRVVRVSNITLAALSRALVKAEQNQGPYANFEADNPDTGPNSPGTRRGFENSVYLHRTLVSGGGECWPLPQEPEHAPLDVPQFGMKVVSFAGRRISFEFAQPRHIGSAGTRVAIREATLSVKMPQGAKLESLKFPTVRRELVARSMARHGDLLVRVGQLVARGDELNRTSGQTLEHELTPEEELRERAAGAALKELRALETEEIALKRGTPSMWARLLPSYRERRHALERDASWTAPRAQIEPAPAPLKAPFDCVVEAIEWEPPTTPTRKGERAQHAARVTLVKVQR